MAKLKVSPTQRKILENAEAGKAVHWPNGRSEYGGWSGAAVVCRRNGWIDAQEKLTSAGREALETARGNHG